MATVHRILGISLLALSLAVQAADDSLQANLTRGVELQKEMAQLLAAGDQADKAALNKVITELAALRAPLCEQFKAYLPPADSQVGKYFGPCNYSDGAFRYELKDEHQRRLATVQVFYHPAGIEPANRGMYAKCLDYPASRVLNRRVWLLVNKVELHVESHDKLFGTDEALDGLVKSFDLAGMGKL